jgi:hypothetical protein
MSTVQPSFYLSIWVLLCRQFNSVGWGVFAIIRSSTMPPLLVVAMT